MYKILGDYLDEGRDLARVGCGYREGSWKNKEQRHTHEQ